MSMQACETLIVMAHIAGWSLLLLCVCAFVARGPKMYERPKGCCKCPPGSTTSRNALPLGMTDGEDGATLMASIGASPSEYWCPHCVRFAIDLLERERGRV